jgi:hypothetical protein
MLAANSGAINRPFCFVLRARWVLGKIDFDIHGPSLCLDVNVVNSKRLADDYSAPLREPRSRWGSSSIRILSSAVFIGRKYTLV